MTNSEIKKNRVIKRGVVVHQKCLRTAKVRVHRTQRHSKYHRVQKLHTDYLVETGGANFRPGDLVSIMLVPRISKRKSFVIVQKESENVVK